MSKNLDAQMEIKSYTKEFSKRLPQQFCQFPNFQWIVFQDYPGLIAALILEKGENFYIL